MARDLPQAALDCLFAQNCNVPWITLIEIAHDNFSTICLCDDSVDVTSNGVIYQSFPFELADADQALVGVPTAMLHIDNIDLSILTALEAASTAVEPAASIAIARVLATAPDDIIQGPIAYKIRHYAGDESILTLTLSLDLPGDEPFPGYSFVPGNFPALFSL